MELTGTQKALAAREAELRAAAPAAQQLPGALAEARRLQAQVRGGSWVVSAEPRLKGRVGCMQQLAEINLNTGRCLPLGTCTAAGQWPSCAGSLGAMRNRPWSISVVLRVLSR